MAPSRRRTRVSMNFTLSAVDIEQQLIEMKRYEQEMADRNMAQNMQNAERQRPQEAEAVPAPVLLPPPTVNPTPTPVQAHTSSIPIVPNINEPPPSPMLAGAPQISRRLYTIPAGRVPSQPAPRSVRQTARRSFRPAASSTPLRTNARVTTATSSSAQQQTRPAAQHVVISSSSSDDSDGEVEILGFNSSNNTNITSSTNNTNITDGSNRIRDSDNSSSFGNSSGSSVMSISSGQRNTQNRSVTISRPIITVTVVQAQRNVAVQEYEPIDNQPGTSGISVPASRRGTPDDTWGDCTMCFETPIQPQGCNGCFQVIGCKTCVENWHKSAQCPSCPLCRRKWGRKPAVASMSAIDARRRAARRDRRSMRNQPVSAE